MHLKTRNVNTAFRELVQLFHTKEWCGGAPWQLHGNPAPVAQKDSRNGPVLMLEEPIIVTYERPLERVLFNVARDANPFFHLYESLWMLSGSNDATPLSLYNGRIHQYSDDWSDDDGDGKPGGRLNGAYGYRWRRARGPMVADMERRVFQRHGHDQLDLLVAHLKADPNSRRAVLQMWNVEDDLLRIGGACTCQADRTGPSAEAHAVWCPAAQSVSKDVCCNLSAMFSLRETRQYTETQGADWIGGSSRPAVVLDMTVTNRSNDLVWGMLGANVVHFSFLQEYMAARLGVGVGVYNQMSNNLHVYLNNFKPQEWLREDDDYVEPEYTDGKMETTTAANTTWRTFANFRPFPLIRDPARFEVELPAVVEHYGDADRLVETSLPLPDMQEPFFLDVVVPMLQAYHAYKRRGASVMMWAKQIKAEDWRAAAINWLSRRMEKWQGTTSGQS